MSPHGNRHIRGTNQDHRAHEVCQPPPDTTREIGYPVASASLARTTWSASLSLEDSTGTARNRLCRWADAGGGWLPVGVAEYGAQRTEDVYFPGQVQRVLVRGSHPGDRPAWGHGGR